MFLMINESSSEKFLYHFSEHQKSGYFVGFLFIFFQNIYILEY